MSRQYEFNQEKFDLQKFRPSKSWDKIWLLAAKILLIWKNVVKTHVALTNVIVTVGSR